MNNRPLDDVIKEGMRLLEKPTLNQEMVGIWAKYSLDIINLISKNSYINYQYSTMVANALLSADPPYKKIDACLRFLISNYSMF